MNPKVMRSAARQTAATSFDAAYLIEDQQAARRLNWIISDWLDLVVDQWQLYYYIDRETDRQMTDRLNEIIGSEMQHQYQ